MATIEETKPCLQLEMEGASPERLCKKEKKNCGVYGAVLFVCLMTLPILVFFYGGSSTLILLQNLQASMNGLNYGSNQTSAPSNSTHLDRLAPLDFFNKESCLSRFESALLRKTSPYMPSSYLLLRLRNYEAHHRMCAPNTYFYRKSIEQLNSGHSKLMECYYVVWIPFNGLGNEILSLVSTFLYAILTNRVLLIQPTDELADLFCEPFPHTTWILPPNFPIKNLTQLNGFSNESYGNMLDKHAITSNPETKVESLPSYVYAYLKHDYNHSDRSFFCNDDQIVLGKVNWLLLQSDLYFVPALYSMPLFEEELGLLFPEKESVFYLLANYLIHPSNSVWGLVSRYYISYLAKADEKIGIQLHIFEWSKVSSDVIFQQVLNCSKLESILPEIDLKGTKSFQINKPKSKAILLTSLHAEYYEKLKSMYYEHSVKTGEFVTVYQPSHEGKQYTDNQSHNQKALAEMYLLSLCDVLITSGWSTFGYVSHGLAGIKPVLLQSVRGKNIPNPPCVRAVSMEPCLHTPPKISCKGKKIDKEKLQQYVKQCEDVNEGIKLFGLE